jgi:hypothetical protein
MELAKGYNLDECIDIKKVLDKLNFFKSEGKLEYGIDGDILRIDDIDLEDSDISLLVDLLDKNDIFEDLNNDHDDTEWEDDAWGDDD